MPTFDPTKPANNAAVSSAELRNQLNALNDQFVNVFANVNAVDTLNVPFSNPPTTADLEAIRAKLNELLGRCIVSGVPACLIGGQQKEIRLDDPNPVRQPPTTAYEALNVSIHEPPVVY
ncbi:MAG: hypothetical protein JWQ71_2181 [Pedosphaera sp.]|nr:hypothetical protein [Pedosphaera sp.]